MIKCIILNGPPSIGKDTLANRLRDALIRNGFLLQVKDRLYKDAADWAGLDYVRFVALCTDRKTKDAPQAVLKGKTPREVLIHVSEHVIKPQFGTDHYGLLAGRAASEVLEYGRVPIFTDCGFVAEAFAVADAIGINPNGGDVLCVRLHGRGLTFDGDSRDYLDCEHPNLKYVDIEVIEGEVDKACQEIFEAYSS